ncbi:urea ABC transporter ATP-binding subunit UrtE [Bacillaceae bacterium]
MLELSAVEVRYGETTILREIAFSVKPGEVAAILGRNGVGKTTLLKTIAGLLKPAAGRIIFAGEEITRARPEQRARKGIAYVPQGREIFPQLTVEENLLLGLEALPRRERTIPQEIYEMFPVLQTILTRRGGDLSGGQQQQLAIARALVSRPKLLLLDEPTEGIQPNIVAEIERVIHSLKEQREMAILLVEQSLDFALSAADSYYVLDKGMIVAAGEGEDADPEVIRPYLVV